MTYSDHPTAGRKTKSTGSFVMYHFKTICPRGPIMINRHFLLCRVLCSCGVQTHSRAVFGRHGERTSGQNPKHSCRSRRVEPTWIHRPRSFKQPSSPHGKRGEILTQCGSNKREKVSAIVYGRRMDLSRRFEVNRSRYPFDHATAMIAAVSSFSVPCEQRCNKPSPRRR